jgi:superoxide dismutase, Fe-Mn family
MKHNMKTIAFTTIGAIAASFLLFGCQPKTESDEITTEETTTEVEQETKEKPEILVVHSHTKFEQTPLAYDYKALEPHIDARTMEIHYTKHAAGYSKNLIEAAAEEGVSSETSVEALLQNISNYSVKMRNNAGGHYNHELFWQIMSQNPKAKPTGALLTAIETTFGSWDEFKKAFDKEAKTRFGSGWAWLVLKDGQLAVGSTPNQDNPLMDVSDFRGVPILGIDVWEHAYYLNYQNRRPDYIAAWWNIINWEEVEKRYDDLVNHQGI